MRLLMVALFLTLFLACSVDQPADQPQSVESQRARDSTIAESKLPGAQGVKGALRISDSVAARNARIDSMANDP